MKDIVLIVEKFLEHSDEKLAELSQKNQALKLQKDGREKDA